MKNLIDYAKAAMVIASVPVALTAQTSNFTAESARSVYTHVQKNGTPRNYQLGQRQIPARYLPSPEDKGGFFAFVLNGVPYLVLTEPRDYGTQDFIDKAPGPRAEVDGAIDDVLIQKGTASKQSINLNEIVARGISQGQIQNAYYGSAVRLADTRIKIKSIPELPRLDNSRP